jgi:hypothetical protein
MAMDEFEAAEILRSRWFEDTDLVHFSRFVFAVCPFCGKGDRVRLLSAPQEIGGFSDEEYLAACEDLIVRCFEFCGDPNQVPQRSDRSLLSLRGAQSRVPRESNLNAS